MSRISELIDCERIYNLCNHCDHFGSNGCTVDEVNCKEEIEKQIVAEIINKFAEKLKSRLGDAIHPNDFESMRNLIDEVVKEQENE